MPDVNAYGAMADVADLRRVSLHAHGRTVDLTVPAAVPIAELMPSILDHVQMRGDPGDMAAVAAPYQLSRPGASALDQSTTFRDNHIRNGTLLVLTTSPAPPAAVCVDDAAEAVSATLADATRAWTRQHSGVAGAIAATWLAGLGAVQLVRNSSCLDAGVAATTGCVALLAATLAHRVYREPVAGLTLGLIATGYAAVAGFLIVPDGPGPPNTLLAAMAAGAAAALTMRLTGRPANSIYPAISCAALIIAVAAAATEAITGTLLVLGSSTTVIALALLEISARLSIACTGLSPRIPAGPDVVPAPDRLYRRAVRADNLTTSLVVASATTAAAGAVCTVAGAYAGGGTHPGAVLFAAVTGSVLLLRARAHLGLNRTPALLAAGTAAVSAALVAAVGAAPPRAAWLAGGIVAPVAVALSLGFVMPALTFSPVSRRVVDLLEYLGLIAVMPLACWACDFYRAAAEMRLV